MSEWTGNPRAARYYGEVVFGNDWLGETDYNYGYSHSPVEPDETSLDELVPEGYRVLERKIIEIEG